MKLQNLFTSVFFSFCFLLPLVSCQSSSDKQEVPDSNKEQSPITSKVTQERAELVFTDTTQFGKFPYKIELSSNGPKPSPGNFVQYHYRLVKNGQEVQSSYPNETPPLGRMPEIDKIKSAPTPLLEGLLLMSEGDSMVISAGPQADGANYYYELVMLKILGGTPE